MTKNADLSAITQTARAAAVATAACERCGSHRWTHDTNGDGSALAICARCGLALPLGRWYQDASVGVRVPAESNWSALK